MTQFSLCKCLLGPAISHAPPPPTSANKLSGSALKQIPPPSPLFIVGCRRRSLFSIPGSYYGEDNKRRVSTVPSNGAEFKKAGRDNIKGTTLISGEHVKPCNETYWKCLITAQEMKLQDDSLIKQ